MDVLLNTAVARATRTAYRSQERRSDLQRIGGSAALLLAALILFIAWSDWSRGVSAYLAALFRAPSPYVEELARGYRSNFDYSLDARAVSAPRQNFISDDYDVFMEGVTQTFRFRVTRGVFLDSRQRYISALDGALLSISSLAPGAKWIDIRVFSDSHFGPFRLEEQIGYVYSVEKRKMYYAPVRQDYWEGDQKRTLQEHLNSKVAFDSVITHFDSKTTHFFEYTGSGWRFPHLNLWEPGWRRGGRFVGEGLSY